MMQLTLDQFDESDDDYGSDDSYIPEEDHLSDSDHDSGSEIDVNDVISVSDDEEAAGSVQRGGNEAVTEPVEVFYGKKNCFAWSSIPPNLGSKASQKNVIKIRLSSWLGPANHLGTHPKPVDIWRLFFCDEILDEVVKHTNAKLEAMRGKLQNPSSNYKNTDRTEIEALIGLMILCCIFKSGRESLASLFSNDCTGRPIFRGTMSQKRCDVLLVALRFDDSSTREERRGHDPAAAVSNIFSIFTAICQKVYSIGAHACVDETLIPFRGRCRFRMYMPSKPAKYGIKVICLTDAHSSYLYNAYIYVGKDSDGATLSEEEKKFTKPTQAVIRLSKCLYGSNRNITADNWFSSIELAQELLKHKVTYVGTVKSNKREIPLEFLPSRHKEVGSMMYGFTKDLTLLSFVPKKSKSVIVLSTMHHSEFADQKSNKPEMISFYNSTKSGIDTLDMKCSNYSANRRTRRWPLAIFYYLISVSCSNAYVMYLHKGKLTRFEFMKSIGISLLREHMKTRLQIPNLPDDLRKIISNTLGEEQREERGAEKIQTKERSDKLEKRKNCRYCPYSVNRMTAYKCIKCETPNCLQCSKKLCKVCVENL